MASICPRRLRLGGMLQGMNLLESWNDAILEGNERDNLERIDDCESLGDAEGLDVMRVVRVDYKNH